MTSRPIPWCSVEATASGGVPQLVVTTYAGDAEVDRIEIGPDADPEVVDSLPRRLAGRLLFSVTTPVATKLLDAIGVDARGEIVDIPEWEALLWPTGRADVESSPVDRANAIMGALADLGPTIAGRTGQLAQSAQPVERRLLAATVDAPSLLPAGDELAFTDSRDRPETLRRIKKGKPVDPSRVAKLIAGEGEE